MLPLYLRLRKFCNQVGRELVFPFAEEVIGQVFEIDGAETPRDSGHHAVLQSLYGRVVRSAEELMEKRQGVASYGYSANEIHCVTFSELGVQVAFGRGVLDWQAYAAGFDLDPEVPLLLKDPFPFVFNGESFECVMQESSRILKPGNLMRERYELRNTERIENPGQLTIGLHIRRGDFRRWSGGQYFIDDALTAQILQTLIDKAAKSGRDIKIQVFSDEDLTAITAKYPQATFSGASMQRDFVTLAMCDLVLSNGSTFSKVAASVGKYILNQDIAYFSLGENATALHCLEKIDGFLTVL